MLVLFEQQTACQSGVQVAARVLVVKDELFAG